MLAAEPNGELWFVNFCTNCLLLDIWWGGMNNMKLIVVGGAYRGLGGMAKR